MPKQSTTLPAGITFASLSSELAAQASTLRPKTPDPEWLPPIIITGPQASGKTRLAKHILTHRHGTAVISAAGATNSDVLRATEEGISRGFSYLFFDDFTFTRSPLPIQAIAPAATKGILVLITGVHVPLTPELQARCLLIPLTK